MEGTTTPPPATTEEDDPPPPPSPDISPPATPPDPPPTMTPSNSPRPPSPSDERPTDPLSDPLGGASPSEPRPPGSTCSSPGPGPGSPSDPLENASPDPSPPVLASESQARRSASSEPPPPYSPMEADPPESPAEPQPPDSPSEPQPPEPPAVHQPPESPSELQPPESPSDPLAAVSTDPLAAVSTDPLAPESPAPPESDPLASASPSEPPPPTASDPLSSLGRGKRKKKGRGRPSGVAWYGKKGSPPASIQKTGTSGPKKKIGRPFGSASKKKKSVQPSPTGKGRGKKKKRIGRPPKILPGKSVDPPDPQKKTKRGASSDLPYQIIIPPYPPAPTKRKTGGPSELPYQIIIPSYPPALPQRKSGPGLTAKSYEIIIPPDPSPSPLQKKITIFKPPPKPLPTEICLLCLRRYDKSDREPPLEEEVEVIEVVDKANPDPLLDEVVKANFRSAMAKESYPKANRLNVYLRFLKIISRYLQIKTRRFRTAAEKNKPLPPFCNECFQFTQNLCDVYSEWEAAKVALQWRFGQVTEAVKLSKSKVSGKLGTSLLKSLSTQLYLTNSKVVDNFRKQLSIKCSLKAKNLFQGPSISVDKDGVKKYSESRLKFPMQDMVGYLKSLIVVFALAVPHKEVIKPKLESPPRKRKKNAKTSVKVKQEVIEGAEQTTDDHFAEGGVGSPPPSPDVQADEDEEDQQENEEEEEGLHGSDTDWSGNAGSDVEFSVGPSISRRWNLRKRRTRGKADGDNNDDIDFSLQLPPLRSARPKVSEEDKKFVCNICNLRFFTDAVLKRHLSYKHEFIMPYNCTHCPQRFKLRKFLDAHMKKAHPSLKTEQVSTLGKVTTCNHCQKEFPSRAKMVIHRKKAHKGNATALFTCETCGKVVRGKFRFDMHLRSHSKETFNCTHPECSRSFFKEGALKAHLTFHLQNPDWTPVRKKLLAGVNAGISRGPYKCQEENCVRAFYKESHLTTHMTLHASSFPCSKCNKVFDSLPDIRSHLVNKHEKKRKIYHCMFCETGFTLKQTFEFHIKVSHPSQSTLVCDVDVCPDEFDSTDELREHLRTVHLAPDVVEIVEKVEDGGIFCLNSKIDDMENNTALIDDKTESVQETTTVAESAGDAPEDDPTPSGDDPSATAAEADPNLNVGCDASTTDSATVSETAAVPVAETDVVDPPVPESSEDANVKLKQDEDILALGLFTCEKCRWSFSTRFALSLHLITHAKRNEQGKYDCKLCTKNFRGMDGLQSHYNSEHGPNLKPIVCTICGTRMQRKERYIIHMRTHQEKKEAKETFNDDKTPYLCSECGESCEGNMAYRRHMRSHGAMKMRANKTRTPRPAGSSALLQCDQCAETFPNNFRLLVHESNVHGKERPYNCSKEGCTRSFFKAAALKNHQVSHEAPTFQCSMCPKAFHRKNKLDIHIAGNHTDEKNHICHMCGKAFARKESLRLHMDVHSEEKKYKCSYCDKAFVRKQAWAGHERTHTKERPYPCRICGVSFSNSSSRKIHEDRHKRLNCYDKLPMRHRKQVAATTNDNGNKMKLRPGRKRRGRGKQPIRNRSRDKKAGGVVAKQEPNATPSSIIHEAFKAAFCDGTEMHGDQVNSQNNSFSDPGLIKQDVLNSIEVLVNYDDTNTADAQTPQEGTRRRGRAPKQKENQNQTQAPPSNLQASDLTCGFCGKVFLRPKAYKAHVDRHLSEDSVLERASSSSANENNGGTSQQSHASFESYQPPQHMNMPTLEPLPTTTTVGFSTLTRRQARLLSAITPPPPQLEPVEPEPPAKKRKGRPPGKGKKTTSEPPGRRLARIVEDVMQTATSAQYNNSRMSASPQNHHQQQQQHHQSIQSLHQHQPVQSPSPHHNFYQSSPSPHQLMQSGSERSTPTMSPAPNQGHHHQQQQAQVTAAASTSTSVTNTFLSPFLLPNPYLLQRQDPSQHQQHFFNHQGGNIIQQQQEPPTSAAQNYAQYQYLLQNQGTGNNAGAQDLSKNSYPMFFTNPPR